MRVVTDMTARIRVVGAGPSRFLEELATWSDVLAEDVEILTGTTREGGGLEVVIEHLPDILLVELSPTSGEALDLIKAVRTRFPAVKIVVLGPPEAHEHIRQVMRSGARAYLTESCLPEEFLAALRAVQGGHIVVDLGASQTLFNNGSPQIPLRRVETQILKLLAQGLPHDEIATGLGISRSTLKRYLKHIESKLNARNRVQAVAHAARQGLI